MTAAPTTQPRGAWRPERTGALAELLAALQIAEQDQEEDLEEQPPPEALDEPAGQELRGVRGGHEIHRSVVPPLQVQLRFVMDGPIQPLMADVVESIDNSHRQLLVALPPDPRVRPEQQGQIHLLCAQRRRLDPPRFTVKHVKPGTMLTLALLELDTDSL